MKYNNLILLTLFVFFSLSYAVEFFDNVSFIGVKTPFFVKAETNISFNTNITYNGEEVINNSNYCVGGNIEIAPSFNATYSVKDPLDAYLSCPSVTCNLNSTPSGPSLNTNITWFSQVYYSNLRNVLGLDPTTYCLYDTNLPEPWQLNSIDAIHNTTYQYPYGKFGNARISLYGYGQIMIRNSTSTINQVSLDQSITPTIISSPRGIYNLTALALIANTSMFVRTYELPSIYGVRTYHCIHPNDGKLVQKNLAATNLVFGIYAGPNLTLTPTQSDYTVTPGGTVTFRFKLNNSGDMNATISGVTVSDGFSVDSFSPSTINAGEVVDFTVSATAPSLQAGTTVTPTISFDFNSTVPVIGTCGAASVANVNVGNVLIGDINPISVRIYATPSGFFNEGNTFLPSKLNITARIWREDPPNLYLSDVVTNISIYYYNTTLKNWRLKFDVTGISGSTGSATEDERKIAWWSNSDGIFINLNETISSSSPFSYVPGVYKVEIRSYDDAATRGSKIQTDSSYFVIFNLPGCARKV